MSWFHGGLRRCSLSKACTQPTVYLSLGKRLLRLNNYNEVVIRRALWGSLYHNRPRGCTLHAGPWPCHLSTLLTRDSTFVLN